MRIHWGRVFLVGFLVEVSMFAVAILTVCVMYVLSGVDRSFVDTAVQFQERFGPFSGAIGSLIITGVWSVWLGRRIASHRVVHGLLVAVVAALLFTAINLARGLTLMYAFQHVLKLAGGTIGGFVADRRAVGAGVVARAGRTSGV